MCANCGCNIPEDDHGDARNIKWSQLNAASEATGQSPAESAQHIVEMAQQQSGS
jgi:hypothetical protein